MLNSTVYLAPKACIGAVGPNCSLVKGNCRGLFLKPRMQLNPTPDSQRNMEKLKWGWVRDKIEVYLRAGGHTAISVSIMTRNLTSQELAAP